MLAARHSVSSDRFPADQAIGLRRAFARRGLRMLPACSLSRDAACQAVLIHLAGAFAERGQRVALLDGDRGVIAPALGLRARYELLHLLTGEREFSEALLVAEPNLAILPAARGLEAFVESGENPASLLQGFLGLREPFDMLLVSGPVALTAPLAAAGETVLFVTSPDNESLTFTYSSIKRLANDFPGRTARIVISGAAGEQEGHDVFERIADCCSRFLCQSIEFGGALPGHADLRQAAAARKTLFKVAPDGETAQWFRQLADAAETWRLSFFESPSKA